MVAIYSRKSTECTTFQISEELKYKLYHNEDGFRYVQYRGNGDGTFRILYLDIPEEIATDLANALLRMRDNGLLRR